MTLDAIVEAVGTPYFRDGAVVIYHADCRDILPLIPKVDLVLTDPPYGVRESYGEHNDSELLDGQWLVRCREIALTVFTPGCVNLFRYPEPDGVVIRYDRTAQSPGRIAWMNKWEPVFVYGQPPTRLAWDVIETATQNERLWEAPLDHPCPKSITLTRKLIDAWTEPGGLILDPFMGSGTTLRAAKDLGRYAIGIEIEEKYCEIAAKRMAQMVMPLEAPA